jgi:type II secretory pathway component PulF
VEDAKKAQPPLPPWAIVLCTVFALQAPIITVFVVPQFKEVFENFGAELPWLTRVVTSSPWIGMLWPAVVALDGWRVRSRAGGGGTLWYVLRWILGSLCVVPFFVVAMYLPIFKLAATI